MKPDFIPDNSRILKLLYKFKHALNPAVFKSGCQDFADFVFKYSKETALMLLIFNAIGIISSHICQIGGLKKSKRENKDYLISQEFIELGLDCAFTVLPPFAINNILKKQIDGGRIMTKSMQEKIGIIAESVGANPENLYHTDHVIPIKEQFIKVINKGLRFLLGRKKISKNTKKHLEELLKNLEAKLPDVNRKIPTPCLEDLIIDFEELAGQGGISDETLKKFYNGSAREDIWNTRNGILISSALAYTVFASCIVTPVIKNLISNHRYKSRQKKQGETKESIKRKKRYEFNKNPADNACGDIFSSSEFLRLNPDTFNLRTESVLKPPQKEIFKPYDTFLPQSDGLRI